MSETQSNAKKQIGVPFQAGNQYAALPYDIKQIRDSLRTNLHKAANFLNLTKSQADAFIAQLNPKDERYDPTEVTVLEAIIVDAVTSRKWEVIERLLERILPKTIVTFDSQGEKTMLDELSEEQKRNAIEAAQKCLGE